MTLHLGHVGGAERHTSGRGYDDGDYNADNDYGSHAATNARTRANGPEVWELDKRLGPVLTEAPLPCRLCEPGYVCAFHRDD